MYDYRSEVKRDVEIWIRDNWDFDSSADWDEVQEELSDEMWADDNVTGNGGAGYANFETIEPWVKDNLRFAFEALDEWGESLSDLPHEYEKFITYLDISIRCYFLDECITEVLEELYERTRV